MTEHARPAARAYHVVMMLIPPRVQRDGLNLWRAELEGTQKPKASPHTAGNTFQHSSTAVSQGQRTSRWRTTPRDPSIANVTPDSLRPVHQGKPAGRHLVRSSSQAATSCRGGCGVWGLPNLSPATSINAREPDRPTPRYLIGNGVIALFNQRACCSASRV